MKLPFYLLWTSLQVKKELDGRAMASADIISARWIWIYASVWELLLGAYDVQLTS
jgi:hypothetical protein